MIGEVVGGYRVTSKIGEGGMGVVYRAEHTIMGRQAVVKVLRAQLSSNREMVQRFFNEARAAAAISHPGIVSVFDLGQRDDGCAYIVMDFLQGESLGTRLRRRGRLETQEALSITRQILSALAAAHSRGIVHRDLKPDNIFLVPDAELPGGERIKLLDFGIAKLQDDAGPGVLTTRAGALMGTPAYMSPEQCRGAGGTDQRADLYAVGVMLFELLTGRPPFVAPAAGDLMAAHMRDAPPRLRDRVSGLPEGLEEIVATLLAKAPEDRYDSGTTAIERIDTLSGGALASVVDNRSPSTGRQREPTDPLAQTLVGDPTPAPSQGTTLSDSANSLEVARAPKPKGSRKLWLSASLGIAVLGTAATIMVLVMANDSAKTEEGTVAATQDAGAVTTIPLVAEADGGAKTSDPSLLATPLADRLPPLVFDIVPEKDNIKAKRQYDAGETLRVDGDIDGARSRYLEALRLDPGHLYARYEYAGILLSDGKLHEAVAVLRQLKVPDCPQCLGRLQRARDTKAWAKAHSDPDFIELVQGVVVGKPTSKAAGKRLLAAVADDEYEAASDLIAPRQIVRMFIGAEGCKGKPKKCFDRHNVQGLDAVREKVKDFESERLLGGTLQVGELQNRCKDNCCKYKLIPEAPLQVREICTDIDSAAVRSLVKVMFVYFDATSILED
jgi:serine/threonine-protein kinase